MNKQKVRLRPLRLLLVLFILLNLIACLHTYSFTHFSSTPKERTPQSLTLSKVGRQEIDSIYANLKGERVLKTYPLAGHENYLTQHKPEWTKDVRGVLFRH